MIWGLRITVEKNNCKEGKEGIKADLKVALSESEKYAARGHKIASDVILSLKNTIKLALSKLEESVKSLHYNEIKEQNITNTLSEQLDLIKRDFVKIPDQLENNVGAIAKNLFSITLFGRTMAGKSTLMEILTRGNGNSIGKGAQRTTRDVRTYSYHGMTITDVPGIAAFEGQEDEDVAFEAARKCDLILFLITDDAPQASEAECLSKILELGKPVICIINIKANIDSEINLKIFSRDIHKKMDRNRLDAIKSQFLDFGKRYGQAWNNLRFAYVHLKSAYLSQSIIYQDHANELYQLSQFDYLDRLIIDEITKNGKFYKLKSFTDTICVPILNTFEELFRQSAENSEQGTILKRKRKKLKKWTTDFESNAKIRIESLLSDISSNLKREVASFAEDNYDNSNADNKWKSILQDHNIEERTSSLLKELASECEEELQEINREINSELKFSHAIFSGLSIKTSNIINWQRVWNWATALIGGGLTIAGLFFSGPIGWVGIAVGGIGGLGSFLFSDHEKNILDARKKLENELINHLDKMSRALKKKMLDVLYNELLKKQLYPTLSTMNKIINTVFTLSEVQQNLAKGLNANFKNTNKIIIDEAIDYTGFSGLEWHVANVVRIPGNAIMIGLDDGKRFPNDARKELSYILKEQIWFIFNNNNLKSILTQAIGRKCDKDSIRIQDIHNKPRIAHISNFDALDANTHIRIRLAQQLTELLIMK